VPATPADADGATGCVILFDFPGADLHLAYKLHGRHEEVEEGDEGAVELGKADLEGRRS
jgi:hypothetical protein